MIKTLLATLAFALLVTHAQSSSAQEARRAEDSNKPVAVLTIANYERMLVDVAYLGKLIGFGEFDKQIEGAIDLFTNGQGLVGFDKKRPFGLVLTTDGVQFQPLILLPVTDLEKLLEALAPLLGDAEDVGDGVWELSLFDQSIFFKEKAGYGCIALSPDVLAELPAKPGELLGGLDKNYDAGVRLYVRNIPDPYRAMLVDQLRLGIQGSVERRPNETDANLTARKQEANTQLAVLVKAIDDIDQLTLGAALDPVQGRGRLDVQVTAVEGSAAARLFAQVTSGTSDFAGFVQDDMAMSLNLSAKVSPASTPPLLAALNTLRGRLLLELEADPRVLDPNTKRVTKEVMGQFFDAVATTLASGRIDAGAAISLGEKTLTIVGGAHIKDPAVLEDAVKKFGKIGEINPNFAQLKFNADEHDGVRFHTTTIAVPQDQRLSKALGDRLDVAVGIGADRAYLALGPDSLALCKSLMDKSKALRDKEVPPLRLNLSLAPIFQFAAAVSPPPPAGAVGPTPAEMAAQLAVAPGKDHLQVVVIPQGNTFTLRIDAEEGVLRLITAALQQAATAAISLPAEAPQ